MSGIPGRRLLATGAVALVAVAAGSGAAFLAELRDPGVSPSRAATDRPCDAAAEPPVPRARLRARVIPVATAVEPTSLALDPERAGAGVLGERGGRVLAVVDGAVTDRVVLDLSHDTYDDGDGGLLGLAYDPEGRWLYVYRVTGDRDDVVTAHPLGADGLPDPTRRPEREILRVDHPPSRQHHGGGMVFGPDGLLYVGLGDGGGLGDPHEHAQDPRSLLGKVLRIEPTPDGATAYRVPADNPFVGQRPWRPEIWALGVRNPYRMSVDGASGDLWLGDVGQSCWEELDRLQTGPGGDAGANLGWDRVEGPAVFEPGELVGSALEPTHAYRHVDGACAVVAGHVARGALAGPLDGWLLFADYCRGRLHALDTRGRDGDSPAPVVSLGVDVPQPTAIVPGPSGRPWVLSLEGGVYELVVG